MTNTTDFGWLVEHSPELHRTYRGQWIAIKDGTVIASGADPLQVDEAARHKCPDESFLLERIDDDADVIYALL